MFLRFLPAVLMCPVAPATQDDARRDTGKAGKELRKDVTANEEENYEEEDGEAEEEVTKKSRTNRRAEM